MRLDVESERGQQSTLTKIILLALSVFALSWVLQSPILGTLVIGMLFFHEGGHLKAAEYLGINHYGMYFLPFLGAVALIEEIPSQRSKECFIALAGPACGLLYSAVLWLLSIITGSSIIAAAAMICAIINLFNLVLPINPLDGGRIIKSIMYSIHPYLGTLTLILANVFAIYLALNGWFIMYIVAIISFVDMLHEFKIVHLRPRMKWFDIIYASTTTIMITLLLIFVAGSSDVSYFEKNTEAFKENTEEAQ